MATKVCEICGKKFQSNYSRQVYCSSECKRKGNNLRQRERYCLKVGNPLTDVHKEKTCLICGKPIKGKGRFRYCSKVCAYKGKLLCTENFQKKKPKKNKNQSLCWDCQNACGGCSWSRSFTPVEGWEARPTKIKLIPNKEGLEYTDSYHVISCPEFIPDEEREC